MLNYSFPNRLPFSENCAKTQLFADDETTKPLKTSKIYRKGFDASVMSFRCVHMEVHCRSIMETLFNACTRQQTRRPGSHDQFAFSENDWTEQEFHTNQWQCLQIAISSLEL